MNVKSVNIIHNQITSNHCKKFHIKLIFVIVHNPKFPLKFNYGKSTLSIKTMVLGPFEFQLVVTISSKVLSLDRLLHHIIHVNIYYTECNRSNFCIIQYFYFFFSKLLNNCASITFKFFFLGGLKILNLNFT